MDTVAYDALIRELREIATLGSVSSLVGWDEQVMLRPGGTIFRADQSALLSRLTHQTFTSPRIGELIARCEAAPGPGDAAIVVREVRRDFDRATKLPTSLVEELAKTTVLSQSAWAEARKGNDFAIFAPWLTKMLDLKRQEAACIAGGSGHPYDALLDLYEPGETAESLNAIFSRMKPRLVSLIARIAESGRRAPVEILERIYPVGAQQAMAREAAALVGFDLNAGRLDTSVHPFCSGIAPGDTRITTRYDERFFSDAFFGTLHETGHAMYEQGLPKQDHFGTALAEATSLGIHESQSRLWENLVGRGKPFWRFFMPRLRAAFPEALAGVTDEQWMFAINDVRPSLVRVEADEATYNLHILLRFELEQAMLMGNLEVAEIPAAWDERFRQYFGIDVPNAAKGCLQDVHWSAGLFGYFPTYALGNMYSAQFFEKAGADMPDLDLQLSRGEFAPLLEWLGTHIHQHGRRYRARELCERVTGQPLSPDALLTHLERKAQDYYGV